MFDVLAESTPWGDVNWRARALAWALSEWAPGWVLTPLAIDAEQRWSLLPDGGTIMGGGADGDHAGREVNRSAQHQSPSHGWPTSLP